MTQGLLPIHVFVEQKYLSRPVQKMVEGWRVEPEQIVGVLTEHFREMGIYRVGLQHETQLMKALLFQLRHSPDILRLVHRAREAELQKLRNRHAG